MTRLTHLDAEGHARMVDVGGKVETERRAIARGEVAMAPETLRLLTEGKLPKGDVLAVARIAGIMAAKRTADLIPLCHPLGLSSVAVELVPQPDRNVVEITADCGLHGRTGVEMEAMTAVSIAALTLYDMCKAVDRGMVIGRIRLIRKSGGRSGDWSRDEI